MATSALQEAGQALEELDTEKLLSAYASNFLFEDTAAGLKISDKEELRSYFQGLFSSPGVGFSDIVIHECTTFGAIEWTWSGLRRPTDEPFRVKGASVVEMAQDKIARETIYYDPRSALSKEG